MKFILHRLIECQPYQHGFNLKTGTRYRGSDIEWVREKILPIKGEGMPVEYVKVDEIPKPDAKPLGTWWSFGYHTGTFLVEFRWRSWTYPKITVGKNIAPIARSYLLFK